MSDQKNNEEKKATGQDPVKESIREAAIDMIQTVFDPEIPVNIWELGLIYDIQVTDEQDVNVLMTLTSPFCPVAESLPREVANKIQSIDGVRDVNLELTFQPKWGKEMMSEEAKMMLGFF